MILVSANIKGGTGKSCLAQNLAVYLSKILEMKVMLVDADPQKTTEDWMIERKENANIADDKLFSVSLKGNIAKDLLNFEKDYDAVIVDCGGHDSVAMRSSMVVASHVLIPFRPKRRDLKLLNEVATLVADTKASNQDVVIRSIITQCPTLPSQFQRIMDAKEACNSFDIPALNAITFNRNVYDDADENGLSVLEFGNDDKAIEEIRNIVEELDSIDNL